ncbi:MAG TPA: pitrilysin family protein [Candidatus Eisenbacteria bacterium]|nr:pitrilysin family protein [Candidatus Eisenbacteria bacterium]
MQRLSGIVTVILLGLAAVFPARSGAQERQIPDMPDRPRVPIYDPGQPVMRKVLKNGVRLLVQEQRTSDRVAGVVGLRAGTLYETELESGLSQVLLRTLQAGTAGRTPHEMHLELVAMGADLEASSGPDLGQITIVTTREQTSKAAALLADVVLRPSFPDSSFESARAHYLQKASDEIESPLPATYAIFLRTMYRGSPLERPAHGLVRSLAEARRSDVVAFYKRLFVGGNLTVCFVGNFDGKKLMAQLEKAFQSVPAGAAPSQAGGDPIPLASDTLIVEERAIRAKSLTYGFPAPGVEDPDFPAFLILDSYLRSGDRSPITFWLPERRLATGVGVLYPRYPKRSSMAVYLGATTDNWKAARDTVVAVFSRLKTDPLDDAEWKVHLRRVQNGFFNEQSSPLVRARDLTRYETMGVGADFPQRFETRLLGLKPEDVRDAAARWMTHSVEVALTPPSDGP